MDEACYKCLLNYIPQDYRRFPSHQRDAQAVFNFKNGITVERILDGLTYEIRSKTITDWEKWIIVFVPASSKSSTENRYAKLYDELYRRTRVEVVPNAIYNKTDRAPSRIVGKSLAFDPTSTFGIDSGLIKGKKIILIDDVMTRGVTFTMLREKLLSRGALDVFGLFVAKTTHDNSKENPEDPFIWTLRRPEVISIIDCELAYFFNGSDKPNRFNSSGNYDSFDTQYSRYEKYSSFDSFERYCM